MKRSAFLILLSLALPVTPLLGDGNFRGPLPAEQRELIHTLAAHHDKIVRKVVLSENGYTATTTTEDKELATALKAHVAYMEKRLGAGAMLRRWDPAFEELVKHYPDLKTTIEVLGNGLKVTVTAADPELVKVAQNHARIVSGFVEDGEKAVHREHAPALKPNQAKQ